MVLLGGPLGMSLAPQLKQYASGFYKALRPLANFYANATGHRQLGLRYDDLVMEEREDVQKALSRLPAQESYDRVFRMKTAFQQSVQHRELPKSEWIKPEDDVRYFKPLVEQVAKEDAEREEWDTMLVYKKK